MIDANYDKQLFDQFLIHAPVPTREKILEQMKIDQMLNPHNDNYHNKRKRRSENEIIADLAYDFAETMMDLRKRGKFGK